MLPRHLLQLLVARVLQGSSGAAGEGFGLNFKFQKFKFECFKTPKAKHQMQAQNLFWIEFLLGFVPVGPLGPGRAVQTQLSL